MVESTTTRPRIALGLEHINKDTRINIQADYYECGLCLGIPYNDPILECTQCRYKACEGCLKSVTERKKLNVDLEEGTYICGSACRDS